MHIPNSFKESDPQILLKIMQENAFATLITTDKEGLPVATSLPFLIKKNQQQFTLQAHFAKANPQWKHLKTNEKVLVIFNGPHCYISPSWYESSGVPTWNYVTVHAYGTPELITSTKKTAELIEALSDKYEQDQEKPWKAQNNYSDKLLGHIVGFEINVQELQGKVKIGQNKSDGDLLGVINALQKSDIEQEKDIAKLIKKYLESKD